MIEFEVKSKTQPIGKRKGQTVYFAQPVSQQHLTNKMVVDHIVRETSLSAGDVSNALISLGAIVRDAFEFEERNNIWNTPYLFNAKEFDEETGLYYYGARYYDPRLSLWISVDPLSELDLQSSSYAFCGNNPINRLDSDGQIWETIWDVGNLVYDVGAAVYHHVTGNHDAAKGNWVDAGADVVATLLPFVPAGSTKLLKGGATVAKGLDKASDVKKSVNTVKNIEKSAYANHAKNLLKKGRSGKQTRLKELGNDPKLGKADKGWIKQEQNQIKRGKRSTIRVPKGKVLAHPRGKEAAKGYSYKETQLQLESNHKLQHKYDNNGKKYKSK